MVDGATVVEGETAGATEVGDPPATSDAAVPGTVDSASTAGTTPSPDPDAQTRSSTSSGRHTMVATMANVNERRGEERMEDRTETFGREQDRHGPKVHDVRRHGRTPPGAGDHRRRTLFAPQLLPD